MDYHAQKKEDVLKEFKTSLNGLSQATAKKRLAEYGSNEIKKTHRFRPIKVLLEQFHSFLIYILIFSAIVSFIIGHNLDGFVIFAIVLVNAGIGFFQTYKAENSLTNLKKLLVSKTLVIRDGKRIELDSKDLVPGDIILLKAGDKINADARLIECESLQTIESSLTGESLPVDKSIDELSLETILAERKNMIYTGTSVVRGTTKAVIVKTGSQTVFGEIARDLQEIKFSRTPIQKRMDLFSKQIGIFILVLIAFMIAIAFIEKFNQFEMFMTGVALAVSAIPEGLPAVITLSFAIAAIFMSKQNVIVRRLPAVESLGSVTVICSDKTGTITKEEMEIQRYYSNNSFYEKHESILLKGDNQIDLKKQKELELLLKSSILCNDAVYEGKQGNYEIIGDPTEGALLKSTLDLGMDKKLLTKNEPSVKKFEFDSTRKLMSVVRVRQGVKNMYSKGAPEKIIDICSYELVNGKIEKIDSKRKKELLRVSESMQKDALRVLGFANKKITSDSNLNEKDLVFLGFAGMIDPPREEVKDAIQDCHNAGIDVKILTGDGAITAIAIAKKIGISGKVLTQTDLEKMTDTQLKKALNTTSIFARVTPHQKLRITNLLQKKGEVVAITGDGVNDALALKSADVGIAMGKRGTDVARDVSDIVLVDDNFASIVAGVSEGRITYDNVKKFTKYLLAVNFSEIFLVLFTLVLFMPLPLLPLQILWINLVTDSFPALALAFEKGENVMNTKPRNEKSILEGVWKFIVIAGFFTFFASLFVYLYGMKNNFSIDLTRTMVLTTSVMFQLFFVYACRTNESVFKQGLFSNKWMNYAVLFSVIAHLTLLYSPLGKLFSIVPLSINNWLVILPFAISGLVIFEAYKIIRMKFQPKLDLSTKQK